MTCVMGEKVISMSGESGGLSDYPQHSLLTSVSILRFGLLMLAV